MAGSRVAEHGVSVVEGDRATRAQIVTGTVSAIQRLMPTWTGRARH